MILERRDLHVVEAHLGLPLVEAKVVVALTSQRRRVVPAQEIDAVDRPANGLAVGALDLEVVGLALLDGALPRIVGVLVDVDFLAIGAVLVTANLDDMVRIAGLTVEDWTEDRASI